MTQNVINALNEEKNKLVLERDEYSYEKESQRVETLQADLDNAVAVRNHKKGLFDSKQSEINEIDKIIRGIETLLPRENTEDDIDHPVEKGE